MTREQAYSLAIKLAVQKELKESDLQTVGDLWEGWGDDDDIRDIIKYRLWRMPVAA